MKDGLTIFAMTAKGAAVIDEVSAAHPDFPTMVVIARDPGLSDDGFDSIVELCSRRSIPIVERGTESEPTRFSLAVSWRWLIDSASTDLVVLHDSLLPKYRGFNPLVSCLINGESQIGVTALRASDEYDRGPLLGQVGVPIEYPIKIETAIQALLPGYRELAGDVVTAWANGQSLEETEQAEEAATYSLWRDADDYRIDWSWGSDRIRRFVDAVGHPYRGASTVVGGRPARLHEVDDRPGDVVVENRDVGKVIFVNEGHPVVVCGTGLVEVRSLVDDETGQDLLPLERFRTRFS